METARKILPGLGGTLVDAEHLEMLGKQAARLSETAGITLNDSVVQTIGHEKLSQEQVRRVVEFANVDAFNRKFASTSGHIRTVAVDGGPADPVHVIQSLNNGARPKGVTLESMEYSAPPDFGKVSQVTSTLPERTKKGALMEVQKLQSKLSAAHEEVASGMEAAKFVMSEALVDVVDQAKRASLQGATPDEVFSAWHRVDPELAKVAFDRARLVMKTSSDKTASVRRLNPEHPVVASFGKFAEAARSYGNHLSARASIEGELVRVGNWLAENGG